MQKNPKHDTYSKYEVARILGARTLQIAMDAPLLTKISAEKLEEINYEPMEIARLEFENDALPITVKQPMPKKKSVKVKKTATPVSEKKVEGDREIEEGEEVEEKEIIEEGEIMELANPEDEEMDGEFGGREGSEELQ